MKSQKQISKGVQEVLDAIAQDTSKCGIVASTYTFCFRRADVSAAFRIAKAAGMIEAAGKGGFGNTIWRKPARPSIATVN